MNQPPKDAKGFACWLIAHRACGPSREWAAGKDLHTIWTTCERGDWMEWLLDECWYTWTTEAMAEYCRAKAPARDEYLHELDAAISKYLYKIDPSVSAYLITKNIARAEYQRVKAEAIRTVIGYPFRDEGNED